MKINFQATFKGLFVTYLKVYAFFSLIFILPLSVPKFFTYLFSVLTLTTVSCIYFAVTNWLIFDIWELSENWDLLGQISPFLVIIFNIAVIENYFLNPLFLRMLNGVAEFNLGSLILMASVVLGMVSSLITIYEFIKKRKERDRVK